MLEQSELREALQRAPARAQVSGLWARAVAHDYLLNPPPGCEGGPQPLWPGGAPLVGGRYTPKGGKPALYLASSADTALAEVDAVLSIGGRLALVGARPFTVLQVRVQLRDVLDLREESTVALLGTTFQELTGNWRLLAG